MAIVDPKASRGDARGANRDARVMARMEIRRRIEVSGIVQGVGFRPYIYRLATERHLTGHIRNTSAGVTIELQGPATAVEEFLGRLPKEAPPLARITQIQVHELACNGDHGFSILESGRGERARTLISPDVAVCHDCVRELFDPSNRRYLYPFINCTNCGPRFTIVRGIPYDRPLTSMAPFKMCPECQAEYEDPHDRRFHAQPNACWKCGPQLTLWNREGETVSCADPLAETAALLRQGRIVAVKGIGGFHLAADATNAAAVELLRARKRRVGKPFAVMVPDLEAALEFSEVDDHARRTLEDPDRPIVLLRKRQGGPIAEAVAPGHRDLGLFLPYAPLHHLLFFAGGFRALVMTSANVTDEPIAIENQEARDRLQDLADYFLVHDRDILWRCDDSVVRPVAGKVRQLRRSRGYVPVPIFLQKEMPSILAVGGELKNTICLTNGRQAFLSQHIGDLENLESYRFFEDVIAHLQAILEIEPRMIAYDLHPDYFSTKWALARQGMKLIGVQHHHAHIASCMAENHLEGRVIGFALDGTGYGTDGNIWGGEVLIADYEAFERAAHIAYVPLPGGSAAIREPWRMAVSYLVAACRPDVLDLQLPFLQGFPKTKTLNLLRMIERGVNSPLTSSCGRLFDAVAALINLRPEVTYEAQAAIELEMCRDETAAGRPYPFPIGVQGTMLQMDPAPLIRAIVEDVLRGASQREISQRFHDALVDALSQVAQSLRERTLLNRVCLSGGTFQNVYLATELERQLSKQGFEVFTHADVPPGDGGLSLGQAVVAAHRAARHIVHSRSAMPLQIQRLPETG
jgi:hydrogenase maturation protein HypF